MMADDLRQIVEDYTKHSRDYDDAAVQDMHRVNLALCAVSLERRRAMIAKYRHQPLLDVYMSDGWSSRVLEFAVANHGDKKSCSKGCFRQEFIQQRGLLRAKAHDGSSELACTYAPPRSMKTGKGALEFFVAGCSRLMMDDDDGFG